MVGVAITYEFGLELRLSVREAMEIGRRAGVIVSVGKDLNTYVIGIEPHAQALPLLNWGACRDDGWGKTGGKASTADCRLFGEAFLDAVGGDGRELLKTRTPRHRTLDHD